MTAISRFQNDVKRLNKARTELKHDQKDIKVDRRELKHDQDVLATLRTGKGTELARIEQERQDAINTFDPADPALAQRLAELATEQQTVTSTFDTKIASRQQEITHDTGVISHDQKELKQDKSLIKNRLRRARKHLQPAELQSNSLKQTNRMRHAVELKRIGHLVGNTKTVAGCARLLLASKNVSFWGDLSTGSDRSNVELLAKHKPARVEAGNTSIRHATPTLKLMQALVAMSRHGHIQINALTGGNHSVGSNHYIGHAVDLSTHTGNSGMIESIARRFGGVRNSETDHIHLDF